MFLNGQKKALFLSSLGGVLEIYDFIIYALLADTISTIFFDIDSSTNALLMSFSVYAVGYFARPFGGIVFGHYGDKYGRKKPFTRSVLLMALSTMLIGLLPTYETIGILAPIILVFLRIAQGFSVGGEIPGAMTFITESFPNRKGLLLGVIFCFVHLGIALGFIVQAILIHFFSSQEMISFAWRIPFVVGGLLGFIIFFLRRYLLCDENFQPFVQEKYAFPVTKLFATHGLRLLLGSIIISFTSMCFVSLFLMLPTYLNMILHLDSLQYSWINCLGALMISVVCMLTGSLVDREDKESILALSIFLTIFLVFLVFYIYVHEPAFYWFAILISSLLIGVFAGCAPAVLVDLYNQDVRYTGIGFAYNVGVSIFSGITPFMIIFTIKISGNVMAPAYLLFFSGLFVLAFVCFYRYIRVEKAYDESQLP